MRKREFLFLQGLAGPFFARLGRALAEAGHGVHRVNLHGGDRLYWRLPGATDYRGGRKGWPAFLEQLCERAAVTDLVLFGDCRPMHAAAVAVAHRLGVLVHVFEEGYVRPDWVTLETGGVNGLSSLPRDPAYYESAAAGLSGLPPAVAVPSSFGRRAREDVLYTVASLLLSPLYPGYRTHRPWHPLVEYAGWVWRLRGKGRARERSEAVLARLAAAGRPYFVFPLQLDCDYQIRVHSPFRGMLQPIELVFASFAAHAPADTLLVVKAHPLDNGLRDWGRVARAVAEREGIADRMVFVEEADIDPMVRDARGVVTVNSTTGTLALAHRVPVVTLGRAVYDIPRVTHQGGLDGFWAAPDPGDPAVFDAMRRVLVDRCLIRGGFFSEVGLSMLVEAARTRMLASVPLPAAAAQGLPARAGGLGLLAAGD